MPPEGRGSGAGRGLPRTGRLELTLKGHTGLLDGVCFSPDGKRLATGARDRLAKVWDTQTGELERTLPGHHGWVVGVCFSPDGKHLATASADDTVKVWDAQTGQD
jgi:WD40 repeat protein